MQRNRRLSVALSRTGRDAGLIRYAGMVARLGTAEELRFVHVLPDHGRKYRPADLDCASEEMWAEVRAGESDLIAGVRVSLDVLTGSTDERLLRHAADFRTDVLFVGRGEAARRLVMAAPCSVWVVPDDAPPVIRRILVPVDFTERAADALQVGCSLARLCGNPACLALHVHWNGSRLTYDGQNAAVWGDPMRALNALVAPLDRQGLAVLPLLEAGADVARAVGRVSEKHSADLVVMATRGRSRPAALLSGSATEAALDGVRGPLLVVKHFGASLGVLDVLMGRRFWSRNRLQSDHPAPVPCQHEMRGGPPAAASPDGG
jgi:nucleotide-binding universal stress UspA family protein